MKRLPPLILLTCSMVAFRISAAETQVSTNAVPGFSEIALATGKLFIPTNWQPRASRADLLVFFHGHPSVVCSNLTWSGKQVPVVVVNYAGLSAAYAGPFQDTNRFGALLREARTRLAEQAGQPLAPGRLAVASLSYAELGAWIGLSEGAVKVAVHRLRQRYRELLRAEIAETVDSPAEVDDEIRHLFTALSN